MRQIMLRLFAWALCLLAAHAAQAQSVLLSNQRRNIAIPEDTTFKLGPFYSSASIAQSVGARWTRSSGAGTDFLTGERRGVIIDDGWDVPLITTFSMHNYLIISRNADLDISLSLSYEYYPFNTQEDRWVFNLADEGVFARLSSEFQVTENIDGTVYWNPSYVTDYVDTRGLKDELGGRRFTYFQSDLGLLLNWQFNKIREIGVGLEREDVIPTGDDFEDQERTTHRASTYYSQEVLPLVTAGLRLEYAKTDYKLDTRADVDQWDATTFIRFDAGERREALHITRRGSITGSLGYSSAKTKAVGDQPSESAEGLTWGLQYDWGDSGNLSRNMRQTFGYRRTQGSTFDADLAVTDTLFYHLDWLVGLWDFGFHSDYNNVDPKVGTSTEYSDWLNTFTADYHLTKFIVLNGSTSYRIRDNKELPSDLTGDVPADIVVDYDEWISTIGTTIESRPGFRTYYQHAVRLGDGDTLDFTRDTVEALFTYTHQF